MNEKKGRILIVDDNPKNIQVLATLLDASGYLINAATDGKQALETVEKSLPDLILLDIMMPVMNGFEACKALKQNEKTKEIPVIFLTAKVETDDIVKGFELGAVDYVTKPFNSAELLARVETHCALRKAKKEVEIISRERKELVRILCHDLTNPIGSVLSVLDLSKEDPSFLDEMKGHIEKIMNNSLQMIGMVRKMMGLEDKKFHFELEVLDLPALVEDSLYMLDYKRKEKKLTIERNIPTGITVLAERTSFLNSVLNNILTNAIKFSMPGSKILIHTGKEKEKTVLSIKDFGVGMSSKLVGDLFDVTKKTTRNGTVGEIGSGFGMPLMQKFVNLYGGEIIISSKEKSEGSDDHGTEIILKLKTE